MTRGETKSEDRRADLLVAIIQTAAEALRRSGHHDLARETLRGELSDLDLARQPGPALDRHAQALDATIPNGGLCALSASARPRPANLHLEERCA